MKGVNKTVTIDGIEIPMRASASSPRTYRQVFGKDLFMELDKLRNEYANDGEVDLEVIENMAYLFAYQANEEIPDIDTWLDQFGMTAIYEAFPQILELWGENEKTKSKEKK